MKAVFSKIGLTLVYLGSLAPWWAIRIDATIFAFCMTYVFRYRRRVVIGNLNRVGAKNVSLYKIYRNLSLLALESMKLLTVSKRRAVKQVRFENFELIEELYSKGKSVVLVGGHMANWEIFSVVLPDVVKLKSYAIYKRLNNKVFDRAIKKSRSKTGMEIVEMNELKSLFEAGHKEPILCSLVFDQRPRVAKNARWTKFLGVETPFYFGMEKIALRLNAAVVYSAITRDKSGKYTMKFHLVEEEVSKVEKGEVLDKCIGILEDEIIQAPHDWLWTHRRWKNTRPKGVELHERKFTKFKGWS